MREKKEINVQIGNGIRLVREQAGLTQARFGEMIGLDTKNVSDIERGLTGIKLATLKRICDTLNVSSDAILYGDKELNDVEFLAERLKRLPPDRYQIIEDLICHTLETFAMLDDKNTPAG